MEDGRLTRLEQPFTRRCGVSGHAMTSRVALVRCKGASLRSLPWPDRGLAVEAALLVGVARLTLRIAPFRWFKPWLVRGGSAGTDPVLADRVRRAVTLASRNVPFAAVCLPQAMAAKVMLARRGIGSSLVIGAGHDGDHAMFLHAWLESSGLTVTGAAGRSSAAPLATFR